RVVIGQVGRLRTELARVEVSDVRWVSDRLSHCISFYVVRVVSFIVRIVFVIAPRRLPTPASRSVGLHFGGQHLVRVRAQGSEDTCVGQFVELLLVLDSGGPHVELASGPIRCGIGVDGQGRIAGLGQRLFARGGDV